MSHSGFKNSVNEAFHTKNTITQCCGDIESDVNSNAKKIAEYNKCEGGPKIDLIAEEIITLLRQTLIALRHMEDVDIGNNQEAVRHAIKMSQELNSQLDKHLNIFISNVYQHYKKHSFGVSRKLYVASFVCPSQELIDASKVACAEKTQKLTKELYTDINKIFVEHKQKVLVAEELSSLAHFFNAVTSLLGFGKVFNETKTALANNISSKINEVQVTIDSKNSTVPRVVR